jgi:hypothetical protein
MNIFTYILNKFTEFLENIYPQLRSDYYEDGNTDLIDTDF